MVNVYSLRDYNPFTLGVAFTAFSHTFKMVNVYSLRW